MKKYLTILPLVGLLAGCATPEQNNTLAGAAAGALIGSAVSNDEDQGKGILIGAAAGAAAGNYLGKTQSGSCVYQRPDGSRYTARCP